MPLYEYKCHRCNKVFEVRQKFSDPPVTVHEECGGETERLISLPSFQFKGTGWYVTDYGKGNGRAPAANGSNGKSETKSESASPESSKSDSSKSDAAKSVTPKPESSSASKIETKPAS